jgi:hypothetical protein
MSPATVAAALACQRRELRDRDLSRPRFDVRYAMSRVDVNARDMRVLAQPLLDELNARGTAAPPNRDVKRF